MMLLTKNISTQSDGVEKGRAWKITGQLYTPCNSFVKKANAVLVCLRCSISSDKQIQYTVGKLCSMYNYGHSHSEKRC